MTARSPAAFVYGAGRLGLAIARLALERGVPLAGIWNPRPLRPERRALAEGLDLTVGEAPPAPAGDLWLIAVPDDAIAEVAARLAAGTGGFPRAAAHCAGAHPGAVLAPLAERGVSCGSWHPAMTLRGAAGDAEALAEAVVAVEGEPEALALLEAFTDALGLARVRIAAGQKARYHTALVLASNGRVALDAAAARLLQEAGLGGAARSLLAPLVDRTERNLKASLPAEALTGPVARGDLRTVDAHLAVLAGDPALDRLYRALGAVALELVPPALRGEGHARVAGRIGAD